MTLTEQILRDALEELANLMQGVIDGDYTPDSFTLQPARKALAAAATAAPSPAAQPETIRLPRTYEEVVAFIGGNFNSQEKLDDEFLGYRFCLTSHDLLSAFDEWEMVALSPSPAAAMMEEPDWKRIAEIRTKERDAVRARLDKYEKDDIAYPIAAPSQAAAMPPAVQSGHANVIVDLSNALKEIDSVMQILYEGGFVANMNDKALPDRKQFGKIIGLAQSWLKHADVIKAAALSASPSAAPAGEPLSQAVKDHCWKMYQYGQISADHTAKQVFEQVLQSLANWLAESLPPSSPAGSELPPLTDELIRDLEFAIAVMGKQWPKRAEEISLRLRDYRTLSARATVPADERVQVKEEAAGPDLYLDGEKILSWFGATDHNKTTAHAAAEAIARALSRYIAPTAPDIPDDLTIWGYTDEDEYFGQTVDAFAKERHCVIGDEFQVTEQWSRERKFKIVGGGPTAEDPDAAFIFDELEIAAPQETESLAPKKEAE